MLRYLPYTLIPLVIFNIVILFSPVGVWSDQIAQITLFSGQPWPLTVGDLMIVAGLVGLLAEMLRATYVAAIGNHMVSIVVLIVYVVEFVAVGDAGNSTFFILTIISLIDVLGGVAITIRQASRDITLQEGGFAPGPGVGPHA